MGFIVAKSDPTCKPCSHDASRFRTRRYDE
jgi:hypothetical protein